MGMTWHDVGSGGMHSGSMGGGPANIVGGSDIDIAVFSGMHGDYSITSSGSARMVADASGRTIAVMTGMDRVYFDDVHLGYDDAAANSARMIGAAFGAQAMAPHLNGVAISLFDQGLTMHDVAEIALANMANIATNEQFVNQVYTNVVGRAPDASEVDFYTGMLHDMGRADMLVMAADSEANAQHIDLVGIMQHGMTFL